MFNKKASIGEGFVLVPTLITIVVLSIILVIVSLIIGIIPGGGDVSGKYKELGFGAYHGEELNYLINYQVENLGNSNIKEAIEYLLINGRGYKDKADDYPNRELNEKGFLTIAEIIEEDLFEVLKSFDTDEKIYGISVYQKDIGFFIFRNKDFYCPQGSNYDNYFHVISKTGSQYIFDIDINRKDIQWNYYSSGYITLPFEDSYYVIQIFEKKNEK